MQRLALIAIGALAMAAVIGTTSFAAGSGGGPKDAIWGGGHFTWYIGETPFERDFSLNAELGRFGDAGGTFVYGRNGAFGIGNTVSCLAVSGNQAVIGGVNSAGFKYLVYFVDNGTPANASRDQVTPMLQLEPNEVLQMPADFPKVCPSPATPISGNPYYDLVGGDIVVRDVS
jgi:hypothetical protein